MREWPHGEVHHLRLALHEPLGHSAPIAAIAAKRTMASVMFGVIKFFITHFLVMGCGRRRLALSSGPVCPGTYDAMDSDSGRRPPNR